MWNFKVQQLTFEIGGQRIGGQPGGRPVTLIGSIFYNRHKIVTNEATGEFDKKRAEELINLQETFSDKTGNPCMIDVVGANAESLRKYIDFVASITEVPLLLGGTVDKVRMDCLNFVRENGLSGRIVYNSIVPESKEEEFIKIHESGVKAAIFLAASFKFFTSVGRIAALRETLPKFSKAGIENILVDTCVVDVLSLGQACKTIYDIKDEFGLPAGCGAHNALATWKGLKTKMGTQAAKPSLAAIITSTVAAGADFTLYGPIENAEYIFPAIAVVDAAYSQILAEKKIKVPPDHPRYKIP
jgi:tetrahydromethanopterin S-methyltransferase subunit H